jgi:hypothetical protein
MADGTSTRVVLAQELLAAVDTAALIDVSVVRTADRSY